MVDTPHRLDAIFSPTSVAVIGASRNKQSIGYALLHNLVLCGFEGPIYPINPLARSIHSIPSHPSLDAVPGPVDLAVVAVPKPAVLQVVRDSVAKEVRGLVVITAGFGEIGTEGADLEAEIRTLVRDAGIRMVGPNCMGVINTDPSVSLNATFAPVPARRGSIGFVSQSGALGVAILNVADSLGIGLTQFVSMGNKADVSGNDLVEHWEHDEATRVICMYLESFGNPRRFTEIAKRVGRKKPILIVKSGRTEAGARAASSHTGALAGLDVTVSAFLDQCGVLRATTIEELFDVARALDRCPLPAGERIAIVTNAGGPAIMATDACVNLGLEMAELSDETRQALAEHLPPEASLANPVDMIASADPASYRRSLDTVLADPAVDMALVINVTPLQSDPSDILDAATAAAAGHSGKPVLAVMMATDDFYDRIRDRSDLLPVYRFPESAALALGKLAAYSRWRRRPIDEHVPDLPVDDQAAAQILARTDEGYLPPADAFALLEAYGLPVARWRQVASPGAAVAAAREIGYPLVLKAVAPDLVHKSDVGAVAVDLRQESELEAELEAMTDRLTAAGHQPSGFLVQEMVRTGREVIFGISTEPRFGPLLMFGLGGKYVEVFRDVRFAVTPLTRTEAREAIQGIRGRALLDGVRGEAPADVEHLVDVLLRLAQLATRHPRIVELDLNPYLAGDEGAGGVGVDARVRVVGKA